MIALLVAARLPRLLVLVPSDALRAQLASKFERLGVLQELGIVGMHALRPVVGRVQHRFDDAEQAREFVEACNVIVATPQSLTANPPDVLAELTGGCSHLFVDEAHHVAARTWSDIREAFAAKRVVQFTATPFREDGRHLQGRIIYSFPLREAQDQGYFSPIDYTSVIDFDDVDRALAEESVARLRADLAEGYDPQKSLAVTLQFIGRFARTSDHGNFGGASMFVARTEIEVDRRLRELYAEDSDWNIVLRNLTEAAVDEQHDVSDFEDGFTSLPDEVALRSLLPKMSTVVYRCPSHGWEPQNIIDHFGEENVLTQPIGLNARAGVAWCVLERHAEVRWGDLKTIEEISYELYVLYFDARRRLLYINNSANDGVFQDLAEAVVGAGAVRFTGSTVYRVMADIDRLVPTNVGVIDAHDQFRRFSMHVGPDVTASFSQAAAGTKSQTNISGGGYRDGEHVSISASLKGRIWSHATAQSLKHWCDWCDTIGDKLLDDTISIDKLAMSHRQDRRQHKPGRRAARLLLATGPAAATCWAAALVTGRAWTWPVPGAARLAFGAVLLTTVLVLLAGSVSLRSYQRTRLALVAGPAVIALDATAVAAALTATPALTTALLVAIAVSLARIAVTTRTLHRLAIR